jgi:phage FluMu protein Com
MMKKTYGRVRCQKCGKLVAENWLVRHLKNRCMKGIKAELDAAGGKE